MYLNENLFEKSVVKLESLELNNIKCVEKGKIFLRDDSKPIVNNDIIGIYGQNGSGKSTIVEAIKFLKNAFNEGTVFNHKTNNMISFDEIFNEHQTCFDFFFTKSTNEKIKSANVKAVYEVMTKQTEMKYKIEYNLIFSHNGLGWLLNEEKIYISKYDDNDLSWGKKFKLFYSIKENINNPTSKTQPKIQMFKTPSILEHIKEIEQQSTARCSNTNTFFIRVWNRLKQYVKVKNINLDEVIDKNLTLKDAMNALNAVVGFNKNISIFDNITVADNILESMLKSEFFKEEIFANDLKNRVPLIPKIRVVNENEVYDFSKNIQSFNEIITRFVPNIEIEFKTRYIYLDLKEILDFAQIKSFSAVGINAKKFCQSALDYLKKFNPLKLNLDLKFNETLYKLLCVELLGHKASRQEENNTNNTFKVLYSVGFNKKTGVPLDFLSEGSKKIICWVSSLVEFYNNPSKLCVIDEFDSGIYEFLLGDLLDLLQKYGAGQLVFTSHNLRPLEVLNKNSLYFTTINPSNKYIQFKNIKSNHNLRDCYLRTILLGGQKEKIYEPTNLDMLNFAFFKAGGEDA